MNKDKIILSDSIDKNPWGSSEAWTQKDKDKEDIIIIKNPIDKSPWGSSEAWYVKEMDE